MKQRWPVIRGGLYGLPRGEQPRRTVMEWLTTPPPPKRDFAVIVATVPTKKVRTS